MPTKFSLLVFIIIAAALAWLGWYLAQVKVETGDDAAEDTAAPIITAVPSAAVTPAPAGPLADSAGLVTPLDRSSARVTRKRFGQYITPPDSPIQPERFSGYHTGADFEIFPGELTATVAVRAVCSGEVALKNTISGYGGVVVQNCLLDGAPVTIIYGHVRLASMAKNIGDDLSAGEIFIGLGADKSADTDGERKHLHLGIHRGTEADVKGYVSRPAELTDWIDPCEYLCRD